MGAGLKMETIMLIFSSAGLFCCSRDIQKREIPFCFKLELLRVQPFWFTLHKVRPEKVGSWRIWYFCHTCQPDCWTQNGSSCSKRIWRSRCYFQKSKVITALFPKKFSDQGTYCQKNLVIRTQYFQKSLVIRAPFPKEFSHQDTIFPKELS